MKELFIPWGNNMQFSWKTVLNVLLFAVTVGIAEAVVIRTIMGAFGMFDTPLIYG